MLAKLLKITRYYQFTITTYFYSHHSSSCFLFIETCFLLNSINKDIITTCHAWQIERNIILFNNTFTPFFLFKKMYIPRADIAINTCKLIVLFRIFFLYWKTIVFIINLFLEITPWYALCAKQIGKKKFWPLYLNKLQLSLQTKTRKWRRISGECKMTAGYFVRLPLFSHSAQRKKEMYRCFLCL